MSGIVILGAGYAGLRLALDLARYRRRGQLNASITLIDRNDIHQLVTQLHLTATDAQPGSRPYLPLRSLLPPEIDLVQTEVRHLEPKHCQVETDRGSISYSKLAVALGSEVSFPNIPGLRDSTLSLRWVEDAKRIRQHVRDCFRAASGTTSAIERRAYLRFVIAGGGTTGCQLIGELSHWVTDLADEFKLGCSDIHLILLEARRRLLPGSEEIDSHRAERILRHKGIDVRLGSRLVSVQPSRVAFSDQEWNCKTVIWTGGVQAQPLIARSGLPTRSQGRCQVDDRLRVIGFSDVYAAGDAAGFEIGGELLPATAAIAVRQGAYLAKAIKAEFNGGKVPAYMPSDLGQLVSLGGQDAVGDLLGLPLDGLPAGLVKAGIEQWYPLTARGKVPTFF